MKLSTLTKQILNPLTVFFGVSLVVIGLLTIKRYPLKGQWSDTVVIEVTGKKWTDAFDPHGYNAPLWLCDQLKKGNVAKSPSGAIEAELIQVDCYPIKPQQAALYVTAKISSVHDSNTNTSSFHGKPLIIGSPIEMTVNQTLIQGQVISINSNKSENTKEFLVSGTWHNQPITALTALKANETMTNLGSGRTVAVFEKVTIEPAAQPFKLETNLATSQIITSNSVPPTIKDGHLTLKIMATQLGSEWLFAGNQPLKIGNSLSFMTDTTYIDHFYIETIEPIETKPQL